MRKAKALKHLLWLLCAFCLVLGATAVNRADALEWADGNLTLNGFLKNQTGYRFGWYGEERGSGLSMFRNTLQLESEAKFSENVGMYVVFRAVAEPEYNLESEAIDYGNFDSDDLNEADFREYYLTWQATERLWVAAGRQQVVWGDIQGFRIMDIVNPLDLRWHYSLESWEDIRIPLHMLNTVYAIPQVRGNFQLVWIPGIDDPYLRANRIYTNPGHRWGLNNPPAGSPFGPAQFVTLDGSRYGDGVVPGVWEPGTVVPLFEDDEADPAGITRSLSDGDIGLRWQQTIGSLTYAIFDMWKHDDATAVWFNGGLTGTVELDHPRVNVFGGSFNYYDNYSKGVFRGEAGVFSKLTYTGDKRLYVNGAPNPNFYRREKKNVVKFGLGYDRNTFFDWLSPQRSVLTQFQVLGTWIMDHDDDLIVPGYNNEIDELDLLLTFFLNWGWANDRVQFNIFPAWNVKSDWGMVQSWIDFKPAIFGGDLTITPKVNIFFGDDPFIGDFGLVRGCSEGLIEFRFDF